MHVRTFPPSLTTIFICQGLSILVRCFLRQSNLTSHCEVASLVLALIQRRKFITTFFKHICLTSRDRLFHSVTVPSCKARLILVGNCHHCTVLTQNICVQLFDATIPLVLACISFASHRFQTAPTGPS